MPRNGASLRGRLGVHDMGLLTTYICDCCGGTSSTLAKFAPAPVQFKLGNWSAHIDSVLLCLSCVSTIQSNANTAVTVLLNSKVGTAL